MTYDEEDYLMLSGIQHYCFCKRQWSLIHVDQIWEDDSRTASGNVFHENADKQSKHRSGNTITLRAAKVSSPSLGLSGVCDVVELRKTSNGYHVDGFEGLFETVPVEYKVGHKKEGDWDCVQLCAEAIALEESLHTTITQGCLYYGLERRRTLVEIDSELRQKTYELASEMHELYASRKRPPAINTPACKRCSLQEVCMPELESENVNSYLKRMEEL